MPTRRGAPRAAKARGDAKRKRVEDASNAEDADGVEEELEEEVHDDPSQDSDDDESFREDPQTVSEPIDEDGQGKVAEKTETKKRRLSSAKQSKRSVPEGEPLSLEFLAEHHIRRVPDLLDRLQLILDRLCGIDQEDNHSRLPRGLKKIAQHMMTPALVKHRDRRVRLMVACCLAEVLRIYAPDAPFESQQLQSIFGLFITSMAVGLPNITEDVSDERSPAAGSKSALPDRCVFHLLRSLAEVKSAIILVELHQQGTAHADEQLRRFVDTLLSSVRREQPISIVEHVITILDDCFQELEIIPQPVLDIVLAQLLPKAQQSNPAAYQVSVNLCRQCAGVLQGQLSSFINGILESGLTSASSQSELREDVLPLIYELHRAKADLLMYILPTLTNQLVTEDDEDRKKVAVVLGKLYASTEADYGKDAPKLFKDFLGRFNDKSDEIRIHMATIAAQIALAKPTLRAAVNTCLAQRLHDIKAEVRVEVVQQCTSLALDRLDTVSPELLRALGERLKDRKLQVRKAAISGLAKIYGKHISRPWASLGLRRSQSSNSSDGARSSSSDSSPESTGLIDWTDVQELFSQAMDVHLEEKLGWIPEMILCCFSYPEIEIRELILHIFDEIVLWKGASSEARTAGLLHVWCGFGEKGRTALLELLKHRSRAQSALKSFLDARDACRESSSRGKKASRPSIRRSLRTSFAGGRRSSTGQRMSWMNRYSHGRARSSVADGFLDDEEYTAQMQMEVKLMALEEAVPSLSPQSSVLQDLASFRDNNLFGALKVLSSPRAPRSDVLLCRESVATVTSSKSDLGGYVRRLALWTAQAFMDAEMVEHLFRLMGDIFEDDSYPTTTRQKLVSFVEMLASAQPQVLGQNLPDILDIIQTNQGESDQSQRLLKCCRTLVEEDVMLPAEEDESLDDLKLLVEALAENLEEQLGRLFQQGDDCGLAKQTAKLAVSLKDFLQHLREFTADGELDEDAPRSILRCVDRPADFSDLVAHDDNADGAIETRLEVLGVLSLRQPYSFSEIRNDVLNFLKSEVLNGAPQSLPNSGSSSPDDANSSEDEVPGDAGESRIHQKQSGKNRRKTRDDRIAIQCTALKVRAHDVLGRLALADNSDEQDPDKLQADVSDVLATLFNVLAEEGDFIGLEFTNTWQRSKVRTVAASLILKLMRHADCCRSLSVEQWRELGYTMYDGQLSVRKAFCAKVRKAVKLSASPLRLLSYLCLGTSEKDDDLRRSIQRIFSGAIKFLRSNYEKHISRAMETSMTEDASVSKSAFVKDLSLRQDAVEKCNEVATTLMPEYVVPYCVHLLAHSPNFPSGCEDVKEKAFVDHANHLKFVLQALVGSLGKEADNFSFLLVLLQTLVRDVRDKFQPESTRVRLLSQYGYSILRRGIKRQENLAPFTGEVRLPMTLYEPLPEGAEVPQNIVKFSESGKMSPDRRRSSAGSNRRSGGRFPAFSSLSPIPSRRGARKSIARQAEEARALNEASHAKVAAQNVEREQRRQRRASFKGTGEASASFGSEDAGAAELSPTSASNSIRKRKVDAYVTGSNEAQDSQISPASAGTSQSISSASSGEVEAEDLSRSTTREKRQKTSSSRSRQPTASESSYKSGENAGASSSSSRSARRPLRSRDASTNVTGSKRSSPTRTTDTKSSRRRGRDVVRAKENTLDSGSDAATNARRRPRARASFTQK